MNLIIKTINVNLWKSFKAFYFKMVPKPVVYALIKIRSIQKINLLKYHHLKNKTNKVWILIKQKNFIMVKLMINHNKWHVKI
jgi:hypothetical protein